MSGVFFDYLLSQKMSVSELVTHRYSPLQTPGVYSNLVKDRSSDVGVILDWNLLEWTLLAKRRTETENQGSRGKSEGVKGMS
jgi:hypothetical protein